MTSHPIMNRIQCNYIGIFFFLLAQLCQNSIGFQQNYSKNINIMYLKIKKNIHIMILIFKY